MQLKYFDNSSVNKISKCFDTKYFTMLNEHIQNYVYSHPYFLIINECHYITDNYTVMLSKKLGLPQGECPYNIIEIKCPLVDIDHSFEDQNKFDGIEFDDSVTSYEHSHIGDWFFRYTAKTGYDRCLTIFFFKNNQDKTLATNLYILGANYNSL